MTRDQYLTHFFYAVGDSLSEAEAEAYIRNLCDNGVISQREARIIKSSVSGASLDRIRPPEGRNMVRADIMRQVLMALMS